MDKTQVIPSHKYCRDIINSQDFKQCLENMVCMSSVWNLSPPSLSNPFEKLRKHRLFLTQKKNHSQENDTLNDGINSQFLKGCDPLKKSSLYNQDMIV